jgi:hypothetical protein
MGFFSGRLTCQRFRVMGQTPRQFGPEHLERLEALAHGKQRIAAADGGEAGWIAGDHILDARFDLAKNIVNDTLHFALRVDQHKVPGDLLRAYTQIELQALAAENPSGFPSQRQKREARLAARRKLEAELQDGRFLRRKACPVLWDGHAGELLIGTTAAGLIDRVTTLFRLTFEHGLESLGAGVRAYRLAEARQQTRAIEDAEPSVFAAGPALPVLAWAPDEASRDFLGNEFLLWLWYLTEAVSDTLKLSDDSEVTVMFADRLVLECPRGQTGRQTLQADNPARLPEARRALRAGKLPRSAGLVLVRHDQQYELTLQAETLAFRSVQMPVTEAVEERARLEERVTQLRHLMETLDLLYDAFGRRRCGPHWFKDLPALQKWVRQEERQPAPALV